MPIPVEDAPVVAAAPHAGGSGLLLPTAHAVGKVEICGDVIECRGGLVEPRAPRLATIHGDDRALIAGDDHGVRVLRIDPDPMVVVAAGCTAQCAERLAAVHRLPRHDARRIHDIRIRRIHLHLGKVRLPRGDARVRRGAIPRLAGVVRAKQSVALCGVHRGEQAAGQAGRHGNADATKAVLGKRGQAALESLPGHAAINRLVKAGAGPGKRAILPWALPRFPQRAIDDVGVHRIEHDVDGTSILILVEHLLERRAPVSGAKQSALRVGSVRMAHHGDEKPVRVARVHHDLRNLLPVAKAEVRPRLAGIGGLVHAVARREVRTLEPFATAHVDDVRIRGREGDGADGPRWLLVEDGIPRAPVIIGLPHAAIHRTDVEHVRLVGNAHRGLGTTGAKRPDHSPAQLGIHARIDLLCAQGMHAEHEHDERKNATGQWHGMRISGREGKRRHHQGCDTFCDTPNLTFAKPKRHYPFALLVSILTQPFSQVVLPSEVEGSARAAWL